VSKTRQKSNGCRQLTNFNFTLTLPHLYYTGSFLKALGTSTSIFKSLGVAEVTKNR